MLDTLAEQEEVERITKLEEARAQKQLEFEIELEENSIKRQTEFERKLEDENLQFENEQEILNQQLTDEQLTKDQFNRFNEVAKKKHIENINKLNSDNDKKNLEIEKAQELNKLNALGKNLNDIQGLLSAFGIESQGLNLAFATSDMILGIQKAYVSQLIPGDPTSLPRAIAASIQAGVFGAANVAKIAGVKFEQGGILEGNSHSNGGIHIEAEGGEAIINKNSMRNPMLRSMASDINVAGGGRSFFESGGIVGSSINSSINSSLGVSIEQINQLVDGKINNIQVQNVATETLDVGGDVLEVENFANL